MERSSTVRANFHGGISQVPLSFQPKPSSYLNHRRTKSKDDDTELSIFDAQRYFNEEDQHTVAKRTILLDSRPFRATPTVSSEASWNSQSGLLKNRPGSAAALNEKKVRSKTTVGSPSFTSNRKLFGRNCLCYGKKSVEVEENCSQPKSPARFISQKVTSTTKREVEPVAKMKISAGIRAKEHSLQQPFSPVMISHRIVNSGRPFVESAGFACPVLASIHMPAEGLQARDSVKVLKPVDDDAASDTSSDLFEIESFSTNSEAVYRRRDLLDKLPKKMTALLAPSECYAPSEVSVAWSVNTAEGGFDQTSLANFSSAASDYDHEVRFFRTKHDQVTGNKNKRAGRLLSCRCENAINVGPEPVRIRPDQPPGRVVVEQDRVFGRSKVCTGESRVGSIEFSSSERTSSDKIGH